MNWDPFLYLALYALIGLVGFGVWWVIYEVVLTRGYPLRQAVFGKEPNVAVALDVGGGMLAMGLLVHSIMTGPQLDDLWLDAEAVGLSLLIVILLLALLRIGLGGLLRAWFRERRDAHGELVTINNELFVQRNTATGLFSAILYFILVGGLIEQDFLNLAGMRILALWNILGVWLLGAVVVVLHSWLYLGLGGQHTILYESLHHNNPAPGLSLMGLVGGVLVMNHGLVGALRPGEHMFNTPALWGYLAGTLVFVLLARMVLQGVLGALFGVGLRMELVRDNLAWGVLDGALIFALFLMLIGLLV